MTWTRPAARLRFIEISIIHRKFNHTRWWIVKLSVFLTVFSFEPNTLSKKVNQSIKKTYFFRLQFQEPVPIFKIAEIEIVLTAKLSSSIFSDFQNSFGKEESPNLYHLRPDSGLEVVRGNWELGSRVNFDFHPHGPRDLRDPGWNVLSTTQREHSSAVEHCPENIITVWSVIKE